MGWRPRSSACRHRRRGPCRCRSRASASTTTCWSGTPDGAWWFEALDEAALPRLEALRARLAAPPAPRPFALDGLEPAPGALGRHVAAVAECVERIAAGELFQANITLRLEGRFHGSAADAFAAGAEALEPRHGAFLDLGGGRAVLSFSPELFLRRTGDEVVTSPIKGTAPREAGAEALLGSAKDAAEHVMIVDLSRNDLGRVAEYGSVTPGAVRAEPHPGLWHLVTDVRARVREGTTDAGLVRAAFPPGSVTGAPKIQALKVIADLEGSQREAYTGAIGFASPHAGLQLNVAIRTLEVAGERAWLGCGGGIVADSDPRAELREALGKAAPIARALGATVPAPEAAAPPLAPPRWTRRPDPARGLLETIAVRGGEPVDAEAHLARLRASARELYGIEPHVELPAAAPDGRLRVLLAPDGAVTVEAHAEPAAATEVALEPRALAGGLGPHKWQDRPHGPRMARGRPRRRRARGGVGERVDRGRGRRAADPARRRPPPARDHARAAARGSARPRGAADAGRSGAARGRSC